MIWIRPLRRQAVDAVHVSGSRSGIRPEAVESGGTPAFNDGVSPAACAAGETVAFVTAQFCREPAPAAAKMRVTDFVARSIHPTRLQSRQHSVESSGHPTGPPYAGLPLSLPVRAARFATR